MTRNTYPKVIRIVDNTIVRMASTRRRNRVHVKPHEGGVYQRELEHILQLFPALRPTPRGSGGSGDADSHVEAGCAIP